MRQKSPKQLAAFRKRELIRAAFARIPRSDNDGRMQVVDLAFELVEKAAEAIESKLEQIGRLLHAPCESKMVGRSNDADQKRAARLHPLAAWGAFFDRCARCHILSVPLRK